jgi:hypothetical protein
MEKVPRSVNPIRRKAFLPDILAGNKRSESAADVEGAVSLDPSNSKAFYSGAIKFEHFGSVDTPPSE